MLQTLVSRIPPDPVDAAIRHDARRRLLDRRAALGGAARDAASAQIIERLAVVVAACRPRSLAAYSPMRDEPDLRGAFERWHHAGIVVALPRVVAPDAPLEFSRWSPGVTMATGAHSTEHPQHHEPVVPELIVVPCLGFDMDRFRLGYGGGYYDRTLAGLIAAATAGVAFDDCEMTGFVAQPHDRALDCIVTEGRLVGHAPRLR